MISSSIMLALAKISLFMKRLCSGQITPIKELRRSSDWMEKSLLAVCFGNRSISASVAFSRGRRLDRLSRQKKDTQLVLQLLLTPFHWETFFFTFSNAKHINKYWNRSHLTSNGPRVETTEPMISTKVPNCSIQSGWILGPDGFVKNYMALVQRSKSAIFTFTYTYVI